MEVSQARAEEAIARGDYSQSLWILEKLLENKDLSEEQSTNLRMLMITSWMGQGKDQKAIDTCRILSKCKNIDLKVKAKSLLSVLEAPSLERPSNWSIEMPTLGVSAITKSPASFVSQRRKLKPAPINLPPTGPTKGLQIGFAIIVFSVLFFLTFLLS
ncbi:hypothetical protein [Prochlorococcus sp. MIT 1341]|uniref:hypothetical protein n=1 Tax=Prochlorococcus sp. MIT 1341 TaxID=3096221 RepID=UPI002A760FC4|nr:hypothetical protein [Prochlorococcus sp. MIT 1341]